MWVGSSVAVCGKVGLGLEDEEFAHCNKGNAKNIDPNKSRQEGGGSCHFILIAFYFQCNRKQDRE